MLSKAQQAKEATEDAEFKVHAESIILDAAEQRELGMTDEELIAYLTNKFRELGKRVIVTQNGEEFLILCDRRVVASEIRRNKDVTIYKGNVGISNEWGYKIDETDGKIIIISCTITSGDIVIPGFMIMDNDPDTEDDDEITFVKQLGDEGCYVFSNRHNITSITIPEGIELIYDKAFNECDGLNCEINFPSTLKTIGERAFYKCTGLTGNIIEKLDNSNITSIGNNAFQGCTGLTGELKIFDNISMGSMVFAGCTQLTGNINILLTDGLTEIPEGAFGGMAGLTGTPSIPSTVERIGNNAFNGCTGLTGELTIPSAVTYIGDYAFAKCKFSTLSWDTSATSVLATIGNWAFWGFNGSSMTNLTIPPNVTSLGESAFQSSTFKGVITFPSAITVIPSAVCKWSSFTGFSFLGSVTQVMDSAFSTSQLSGKIVIPNTVTRIESAAFGNCSKVTGLDLGTGVTYLGNSSFSGLKIGDLTLPSSLTSIGTYVFSNCTITSLGGKTGDDKTDIIKYLEENTYITSLGGCSFKNCSALTGTFYNRLYTLGGSVSLGKSIFENTSVTISVDWIDGLTQNANGTYSIKDNAYTGVTSLTGTVDLSKIRVGIDTYAEIVSIGTGAFSGCTEITEIVIPNTVTSIGSYAFERCFKLETINIPSTISTINTYTFSNCSKLSSITIPSSVTTISKYAFHSTGLTSITIPSSVNSIGEAAFYSCASLTSVDISTEGNELTISGSAFQESGLTSITIPSRFDGIVRTNTFYSCTSLTSITFSGTITRLRDNSIRGCTNLTTVNFTNGIQSIMFIEDRAFQDDPNLVLDLRNLPSGCSIGTDVFLNSPKILKP